MRDLSSIFRLYSEADPTLSKILRNVKLAVVSLQNFVEVEKFGESCIAPSLCEMNEHLPSFSMEELERCLYQDATGAENVPELLGKLSECLREQTTCCRIVPLTAVAIIFKSIYTSGERTRTEHASQEDQFAASDALSLIQDACRRTKAKMVTRYVAKGKVSLEMFELYFSTIEASLRRQYIENDGEAFSYSMPCRPSSPT